MNIRCSPSIKCFGEQRRPKSFIGPFNVQEGEGEARNSTAVQFKTRAIPYTKTKGMPEHAKIETTVENSAQLSAKPERHVRK